jgi:hypothetical protein
MAITNMRDEQRREKEEAKEAGHFIAPDVIHAEPWMRDPIDAVQHLAAGDGELKTKCLVVFEHCVIYVHCGKDQRTSGRTFTTNDVTQWYMRDEDAAA